MTVSSGVGEQKNGGRQKSTAAVPGEAGTAARRAAEWGLVLKTDDETGKPQGVKVRTSGDEQNNNAKPGNSRRDSGNSMRSSGDYLSDDGTGKTAASQYSQIIEVVFIIINNLDNLT